jgi:large repetitive protein
VPVDDPDATTLRDQPVVIEVMRNDRDPDPTLLEVGRPERPKASAERRPDGTVRYSPEAGFTGTDTFRYDYCGGPVVVIAARASCPSATVTVTVTAGPVISSIEPGATSPGRPVTVGGNTGSCDRTGTLVLKGTGVTVTVTGNRDGDFTTSLPVPAGTFPGRHTLELGVDCKGRPQRAERPLTVTNQAPVAADDLISTVRDQAVTVRVTDNDHDPDDPDGYRAFLLVTSPPGHGSAEEQPDLTVVYTPRAGFVGTDRFRYSLCDDVLNAARQADCGAATITVTVTDTPVISSVTPAAASPGRPVRVVGNTGSCNRAGTLTFSGAAGLRMRVTGGQDGGFTASFTVPAGTFPRVYTLELGVDCRGQVQRAQAELTVANQAPRPADDETSTPTGAATTIDVTSNDRDPDTYWTLLMVVEQPGHGTAEAQPDQSIVYTPDTAFSGTDRFRYALCDDVVNAAEQADCGLATVTVRVDPVACTASERDNPSLRVEPARGSGGTRLHITGTVGRRLASCQLRLLLGGTPLAPDVNVGDDGTISTVREVPPTVKPGPNPMRLATLTAQTLAETSFEVVGPPPPLLPPSLPTSWPVRLLLSAGALAAGFLARAAFQRWRTADLPDDLRAEPHTRPARRPSSPFPTTAASWPCGCNPISIPVSRPLRRR